jgi:hypothetical protein
VSSAPVRFLGLQLTATMAVLSLPDNSLLLYSPVAMTRSRRRAVGALGPVMHLYAPNLLHHLWMGEWASAFPSARVHAPERLARKRPDLRIDRVHNTMLGGVIDDLQIDGFRLDETVLVYRPSRTLPVADPGLFSAGLRTRRLDDADAGCR